MLSVANWTCPGTQPCSFGSWQVNCTAVGGAAVAGAPAVISKAAGPGADARVNVTIGAGPQFDINTAPLASARANYSCQVSLTVSNTANNSLTGTTSFMVRGACGVVLLCWPHYGIGCSYVALCSKV